MQHRNRLLSRCPTALLAAVVLTVASGGPVAEAQQDALTGELVMMLEADVPEEIVLEWLESVQRSPGPLSADDLVALKKAGASPALMRRVLELSQAPGRSSDPSDPAAVNAEPVPEPSTFRAENSAHESAAGALATMVLSYLSRVEEPDPVWDLYVYIDGLPVSYVSHRGMQNRPTKVEFVRKVAPGRHTIRVTQERHERRRGGWEHWTRMADEEFVFEVEPGLPIRVELEFHERLLDPSDPLAFKLVQGDRIVDSGRVGGEAEFWPLVCEDIEASVPEGKEPNRAQRRHLDSCVRWDSLWEEAPSRAEVLDAMSEFEYRPLPKGS